MKLAIRHSLALTPAAEAAYAVQHLLVTPQSGPTQTVGDWRIEMPGIDGAPAFTDAFGNIARLVSQRRPDGKPLTVSLAGEVETLRGDGVVGAMPGDPVPALFKRVTPPTRVPVSLYARFRHAERANLSRLDLAHALMAHISEALGEEDGDEDDAPPKTAADFAQAFIGCARALDMPARYVSGYLAEAPEGSGRPAPAVHAWAEAQIDGLGWVGFDPMLDQCPTEAYIRIASGLDARSAMAIRCHPVAEEAGTVSLDITVLDGGDPAPEAEQSQSQSQSQGPNGQSQSQTR